MPVRVGTLLGDLQNENPVFPMNISNLYLSANSQKRRIAETMQKESTEFVEPEIGFALHKHRQQVITP